MPPPERAALSAPRPSGPACRTSRARLGSRTWCEKPSISAAAVSSISTSRPRSVRIAAKNSGTLRQSDAGFADTVALGAPAGSSATAPARKPTATMR